MGAISLLSARSQFAHLPEQMEIREILDQMQVPAAAGPVGILFQRNWNWDMISVILQNWSQELFWFLSLGRGAKPGRD